MEQGGRRQNASVGVKPIPHFWRRLHVYDYKVAAMMALHSGGYAFQVVVPFCLFLMLFSYLPVWVERSLLWISFGLGMVAFTYRFAEAFVGQREIPATPRGLDEELNRVLDQVVGSIALRAPGVQQARPDPRARRFRTDPSPPRNDSVAAPERGGNVEPQAETVEEPQTVSTDESETPAEDTGGDLPRTSFIPEPRGDEESGTERVMNLMRIFGELSTGQIVAALGVPRPSAHRWLDEVKERGQVTQLDEGKGGRGREQCFALRGVQNSTPYRGSHRFLAHDFLIQLYVKCGREGSVERERHLGEELRSDGVYQNHRRDFTVFVEVDLGNEGSEVLRLKLNGRDGLGGYYEVLARESRTVVAFVVEDRAVAEALRAKLGTPKEGADRVLIVPFKEWRQASGDQAKALTLAGGEDALPGKWIKPVVREETTGKPVGVSTRARPAKTKGAGQTTGGDGSAQSRVEERAEIPSPSSGDGQLLTPVIDLDEENEP